MFILLNPYFTFTISSGTLTKGTCHIISKIFLLHGMVLHPTLCYSFTCLISCEGLNSAQEPLARAILSFKISKIHHHYHKEILPITYIVAHTRNNGMTCPPLPCIKASKQLISCPRSSPQSLPHYHSLLGTDSLQVVRGEELHLSHSLLLYRSAASLTLVSICVHKRLIYEHCLQNSQAFWTSTLHGALIIAPVISSARS